MRPDIQRYEPELPQPDFRRPMPMRPDIESYDGPSDDYRPMRPDIERF